MWLRRANSSCAARLIPYFSASCSVLSPRETVHCSGMFGLTMRQPSVVECSVSWPAGKPLAGFCRTQGARLIDSTPPATTTEASPTAICLLACMAASSPEPHNRLTVVPGTLVGQPASSVAMRATLRLSSPAPLASPSTTSSTASGFPPRSARARSTCAPRSSGRTPDRAPP